MTGYEEAVTDPSYVAQVLCFSYPLIGTYGVDEARMESDRVQCEGVVMRDARPAFAGWLRERGVVALTSVDTRRSSARSATAASCAVRSATRRSRSSASGRSPSRSSTATRCRATRGRRSRTRSARGRASSSSTSA